MSVDVMDATPCDVWEERTVTARKQHVCRACRGVIEPGTKYQTLFTIHEGEREFTKRCMRCKAIFEHLRERMRGSYDEAPAWLLDCGHTYLDRWGEDPPDEIAALAFALPGEVKA